MNAPELALSANARRRCPGVKVPVAAPNIALERTRPPSCWSERPPAGGNCAACGCSAAGSSSTAGGKPVAEDEVVTDAAALELEEVLVDEAPQPASV